MVGFMGVIFVGAKVVKKLMCDCAICDKTTPLQKKYLHISNLCITFAPVFLLLFSVSKFCTTYVCKTPYILAQSRPTRNPGTGIWLRTLYKQLYFCGHWLGCLRRGCFFWAVLNTPLHRRLQGLLFIVHYLLFIIMTTITEQDRAKFMAFLENFRNTMTEESAKEFREEVYRRVHFKGDYKEYWKQFYPKGNWAEAR
jgi:hypothetical protein